MFDVDLRGVDDAAVVAAIERGAAEEAAAAARRLAAVAELARRRCGGDARADWACDSWDAAAAEVAAALGVSHGRALGQIRLGLALAGRLPRVAGLLAEGLLGCRVVAAIAWRTALVEDADALAALDAALAAHCRTWGPLSEGKLERAIDTWVDAVDPGALRRSRARARSRDVEIGGRDDDSGTSAIWGRLWATDAAVLRRRLAAMAAAVCPGDPRTAGQRRADALGALAAGSTALACRCGAPGCPATGGGSGAAVVIHVLAEPAALNTDPDPNLCGPGGPGFTRGMSLRDYLLGDPEPPATGPPAAAVIAGGPAVPPALLAELIATGATVTRLRPPPDTPEPGYRPSAGLAQFVRLRDLTCRFPHCDVPAEHCDIDHAIPWPTGATHPANTRCLCRKHHLLKTFWGWTDIQHPDATITWTSPTGQTYTTVPGSRTLFPDWDTTAAPPTPPTTPPAAPAAHTPDRNLRMPRRRRTRLAEQACRTRRERALNTTHLTERNKPPPF